MFVSAKKEKEMNWSIKGELVSKTDTTIEYACNCGEKLMLTAASYYHKQIKTGKVFKLINRNGATHMLELAKSAE
jgi:hypothetical protein